MLNIGPQELLIILIIALIVVGPQRLPTLGRSIGRGLRELRKTQDEFKRTIRGTLDEESSNGTGAPAGTRSSPRPDPPSVDRDGSPARPGVEPTPTASDPLPADDIRDISRSLGRSLSEIRRAKEEVQRSFRIQMNDPTPKPSPKPKPSRPPQGAEPARDGPAPDDPGTE